MLHNKRSHPEAQVPQLGSSPHLPKLEKAHAQQPRPSTSSVQSLSRVLLFATPWTTACQASLSITSSWSSPKLMSIGLVMPSSHLILCCLLLLSPQPLPASGSFPMSQLFAWGGQWSFSLNISPSNEHPGLISFRMDWVDLLAVQGTLKSLFQHHSSKASILRWSAFFIVQLSQTQHNQK